MTTKRRMMIEVVGQGTTVVDYDVQYDTEGCYGAKTKAIQSFVWESYGSLSFGAVEGEKNYEGWSRCTINVSGPVCIGDDDRYSGGACLVTLDPKDEEDMATQLCWDCRNPEEEE